MLLLPLEFSKASVEATEKIYKKLAEKKKLVVPGQAVREFYKNRGRKLADIAQVLETSIERAKTPVFEKSSPLLENDPDYAAAREAGKEYVRKGKELAESLSKVIQRLKKNIGDDPVSALYRRVLSGCVKEFSFSENSSEDHSRAGLIRECARRAKLQIAPGYKDSGKDDGGIGDFLIWKTILQEAATRRIHCIFVTEEQKADWWIRKNGAFQPRPELLDEYRRCSGGKSLYLLPYSGLTEIFGTEENIVEQIKEAEKNNSKDISLNDKISLLKLELDDIKINIKETEHRRNLLYKSSRLDSISSEYFNRDSYNLDRLYGKLTHMRAKLEKQLAHLKEQAVTSSLPRP
ncbi:PIN domain-containing protein [Acetobacter sp. AN02]|nr:PIN domain-containing protein [Acetobacter sp. AN02]